MIGSANDPRSDAELFAASLQAEDDGAWDAVAALHWRGSKEVLEQAISLTSSRDLMVRGRAADILSQLGLPDRTFPLECFTAVLPLLADSSPGVIRDAIYALHHIDAAQAAPHTMRFARHTDADIRQAVAYGLGGVETSESLEVLLLLMKDHDADVRSWATFGVGQQSECDTAQIRAALFVALSDDDPDVRYEGVVGLGLRRDKRALPYLKLLLHEDPSDIFAREAAARLVGLEQGGEIETADLLGALQRLQRWSGNSTGEL